MDKTKRRYPARMMPKADDSPIGKKFNALVLEVVKVVPVDDDREMGFFYLEMAMAHFAGSVLRNSPPPPPGTDAKLPFQMGRAPCRG